MRATTTITRSAVVAMGLVTSGCTRLRGHQGYIGDATLVTAIQPGVDNKDSVQTTLGRPTFTGQWNDNEWYYFARDTQALAFSMPKPTSQSITKVSFDQAGNVAAVTTTGMEHVAKISPNGDKTPTLGRHTSFFEEIFGNIGTVGAGGAQGSTPNSTD